MDRGDEERREADEVPGHDCGWRHEHGQEHPRRGAPCRAAVEDDEEHAGSGHGQSPEDDRERVRATALVEHGHGGASARVVAAEADVAAGLIYYHYGDLDSLFAEASRHASATSAEVWAAALADCTTLTEIVDTARRLHETERVQGNLVMLAQLLAGARGNETLTTAVNENFTMLAAVVEDAIRGVLADTPLDEALDPARLARTVSAGFVGLELFDDTIPDGTDLFEQLRVLAVLADEVLSAGWITTAWLRRRLRTVRPSGPGDPAP